MAKDIRGAKGGGSQQPRTPVESPNTLKSTATIKILDLVSEGEIVGLVDGLKSVYLNETPVQNADDSYNFDNVQLDYRVGTQDQSFIPGFPAVENELAVGVELTVATPYTRQFTNLSMTSVRVRLSTPALSKTNATNGDIGGYTVQYAIDLSVDDGPYTEILTSAFQGKTMSKYERAHLIELPQATDNWNIRVRRITSNSGSSAIQDKTFVESMTEIVDGKFRYPNSALMGLEFDAVQFQNVPSRAYRLKGRIIRIPSNYDPEKRTYTGIWDGTFTTGYSNNPVWCFFDMVTNERYGLGHLLGDQHANKWTLYKIAKYCDGWVPNGDPKRATLSTTTSMSVTGSTRTYTRSTGSFLTDGFVVGDSVIFSGFANDANNGLAVITALTATTMEVSKDTDPVTEVASSNTVALTAPLEPRFTCNLFMQTQAEAFKVIQDMATVFRGMMYWASGEIMGVSDMPEDSTYVYTPANVVEGRFTYHGTGRKARHTVALVTWADLQQFGRQKVEYVDDPEGIERYGIRQTDMMAIGCTSQGQAQRLGRYALITAQYETQTVEFSVGLDGTLCAPGKIIQIADPLRAGRRSGGRVKTATTTVVTLDSMPEVLPAIGDTLICINPDGNSMSSTISAVNAGAKTITVSPAFTVAPNPESVWAVEYEELKTQTYRVLSVVENEGSSYSVTCVQHNTSKFDAIDFGTAIDIPVTAASLNAPPNTPTNVTIAAHDVAGQVNTGTILNISWESATGCVRHIVEYQRDDGDWIRMEPTAGNTVEVRHVWPGVYRARVYGESTTGSLSPASAVSADLTVLDQSLTPGFVDELNADIAAALLEAENAAATADGAVVSFWQDGPPTIGAGATDAKEGDIWFDTNDGNRIWRVVSGVWVDAQDDQLAQALASATTAQATADGKVKTWFDDTAPTAPDVTAIKGIGDLWFNTVTKKLFRWNGTTWNDEIADVTLDQIGGSGMNLLKYEHSVFLGELPVISAYNGATLASGTYDGTVSAIMGGSLKVVTQSTNIAEGLHFGVDANDFAAPIVPGDYLVSYWAKSSVAGHQIRFGARFSPSLTYASSPPQALTTTLTRYVGVMTVPAGATAFNPYLWVNISTVAGRTVHVTGLMIEPMVGRMVTASAFTPGNPYGIAVNAIQAASAAQDTADGKIDTFFQDAMPTGSLGDLWFDTNDGNKVYRHNGTTFVECQDDAIAQAILDAAGAQATADGKIQTFYAASAPTASAVGDLWVDTDDKNKLYRWSGSAWIEIRDVGINDALTSLTGGGNLLYNSGFEDVTAAGTTSNNLVNATYGGHTPRSQGIAGDGMSSYFVIPNMRTYVVKNNDGSALTNSSDWIDVYIGGVAGYEIPVSEGKEYISSVYAAAHRAEALLLTRFYDASGTLLAGGGQTSATLASGGTKLSDYARLSRKDTAPVGAVKIILFLRTRGTGAVGTDSYGAWVRPMVEEASAAQTNPSPWAPSSFGLTTKTLVAIANAAFAQSTADGKITLFRQATAPTTGIGEGDIWVDTDDGKMYVRVGAAWVYDENSAIGNALDAAVDAQATADGKAATFYDTSTPTAEATGDLWFNPNTGELKRWNGSAWTSQTQFGPGANGANLIPNANFAVNATGALSSASRSVNEQVIDGWKVSNVTNTYGGVTCRWFNTINAIRCEVAKPIAVPNGTTLVSSASTIQKINVDGGATYTLSYDMTAAYNGSVPAGVTMMARVTVNYYDASDTVVGTTNLDRLRGASAPAPVDTVAPATASYALVVISTRVTNNSGGAWTHDNTVALRTDYKGVQFIRKMNLDTNVEDGTTYGKYASVDRYLTGGVYRLGLRYGASGHRLGDSRNVMQGLTAGYGSVATNGMISATSAGAVSITAFTMRYGSVSVSYNAVSNAITGLTVGETYVIYCLDESYSGGTRTWFASASASAAQNAGDGVVIAGPITIPSSGTYIPDNPDDPGCVVGTMLLPDGRMVKDLMVGDMVPCWNMNADIPEIEYHPVLHTKLIQARSSRMVLSNGCVVDQSDTTPMCTRDGRVLNTPDTLGAEILTWINGQLQWATVDKIIPLDSQEVVKMDLGDRVFFAGTTADMTVATHNARWKG